jgi:hypothetical protein
MSTENQEFIVYEADCIEHGERFYCHFKSRQTDSQKLHKLGEVMASGWGAECIEVKVATEHDDIKDVFDADKAGY